jgi:hypothetical protein
MEESGGNSINYKGYESLRGADHEGTTDQGPYSEQNGTPQGEFAHLKTLPPPLCSGFWRLARKLKLGPAPNLEPQRAYTRDKGLTSAGAAVPAGLQGLQTKSIVVVPTGRTV